MDLDTMSNVLVRDIKVGDEIVNVGTVRRWETRGVWFLIEVDALRTFMATGRINPVTELMIRHEADIVTIVPAV